MITLLRTYGHTGFWMKVIYLEKYIFFENYTSSIFANVKLIILFSRQYFFADMR